MLLVNPRRILEGLAQARLLPGFFAYQRNHNSDLFSAFIELLQHVSKGGPNSPILSPTPIANPIPNEPDPSTVGSG